MISLFVLLALLGAPVLHAPPDTRVMLVTEGLSDIDGVACHSRFKVVDGHAQALCNGAPDNTIIIRADRVKDTQHLWELLGHETWHLVNEVVEGDTPWQRFREAEAYEFGREYAKGFTR
jgi:hypothetical protein